MSNVIEFVLPCPPSANDNWEPNGRGGMKKTEVAKVYVKSAGWLILEQIGMETAQAFYDLKKPLDVTLRWYRPARRGDTDNIIKLTLDAMQGVLYKNDNIVSHLDVTRFEDKQNPRLEVVVKEWVA